MPYYVDELLQSYLPRCGGREASLRRERLLRQNRGEELGCPVLVCRERGAAWTLIHPEFSVAVPQPDCTRCARLDRHGAGC